MDPIDTTDAVDVVDADVTIMSARPNVEYVDDARGATRLLLCTLF